MNNFDIVIIGSGMGGLVCGDILSREGYTICVVEKKQTDRRLSFKPMRAIKSFLIQGFIIWGGLDKGQNLYQIFKYLDLIDKLKLQKMGEDAFDKNNHRYR